MFFRLGMFLRVNSTKQAFDALVFDQKTFFETVRMKMQNWADKTQRQGKAGPT